MRNLYITLVLVGVFFFFIGFKNFNKKPDLVACTMEALLCPDGSAVGRGGPKCEFSACPNQKYFSGKLTQQGGDYFLIIPVPKNSIQEVAYNLPLKFSRISNALGTLVGKNVRVEGVFSAGNTLSVSAIEEISQAQSNITELRVGETKFVNGLRITLNKIVEDSRCPKDVTCIWAGRVISEVTLESDTDKETLSIESMVNFDSFKISVIKILPGEKISTSTVSSKDYRLTFKIESL